MDDFSVKAFLDVFNERNRIDYIASCTSEWHLISAMTFLNDLYEKKQRKLSGIIIICEHIDNGYIIRESLLNLPSKFGAYIYKRDKGARVHYNIKKPLFVQKDELYIMSVQKPWLKMSLECKKIFRCKIFNVIIDEGAGSYGSIFARMLANYQEWKSIIKVSRDFFLEISTIFYLWILRIPIKKYLLLNKKRGRYIPNQLVVKHFKKIVKELPKEKILFQPVRPYALLLVQPLAEQGCMNVDAVLQCFFSLKEKCETRGITLYVKQHPRFPDKEYARKGFQIVEEQVSIENLLISILNKPEFVCGFTTTALITTSLLFGIKSYSLSRLILENRDIGNHYFRNMLEKYDRKFKMIAPEFSYDCLNCYGEKSC